MKFYSFVFLASFLIPSCASSAELLRPSFNCMDVETLDEKVVCEEDDLAKNDLYLHLAHEQAIALVGKQEARVVARNLLDRRKSCGWDELCVREVQREGMESYRKLGVAPKKDLVAASVSQIYRAENQSFPRLTCKNWGAELSSMQNTNSNHAKMSGKVTRVDLLEYCLRDPGGITSGFFQSEGGDATSVRECVLNLEKSELGKIETATANCDAGSVEHRSEDGTSVFRVVFREGEALWTLDGVDVEPHQTNCADGSASAKSMFELLCPIKWHSSTNDGEVDPTVDFGGDYTQRALNNIRTYYQGVSGSILLEAQSVLRSYGSFDGRIDGRWGYDTERAFRTVLNTYTAIGGNGEDWGINTPEDTKRLLKWIAEVAFAKANGTEFPD